MWLSLDMKQFDISSNSNAWARARTFIRLPTPERRKTIHRSSHMGKMKTVKIPLNKGKRIKTFHSDSICKPWTLNDHYDSHKVLFSSIKNVPQCIKRFNIEPLNSLVSIIQLCKMALRRGYSWPIHALYPFAPKISYFENISCWKMYTLIKLYKTNANE